MSTENTELARSDSAPPPATIAPPADGVPPPEFKLSEAQVIALGEIMKGKSTKEVADAAGVDRSTLWRWRNFDSKFMAALNRWRHDLHGQVRDRVLTVIEDAVSAVQQNVQEKDGRLGLAVLEKTDNLKPGPTTPLDPYAIFGAGIDDENGRHTSFDGFIKLRHTLNAEQQRRIVQLFALGILTDNARIGRESSQLVMDMARLPGETTVSTEPKSGGALVTQTGRGLSEDASEASALLEPPPSPRTKSVTVVTAHRLGQMRRVGTIFRR